MTAPAQFMTKTDTHYILKGRKFVRVTTLLHARGLADFSKIPEADRQFYMDRGTANHKMWEDIEKGVDHKFTYDPRVELYRAAHARFLRETGFKPLPGGIELFVKMPWESLGLPTMGQQDEDGVAGSLDRLGTIQSRLVLLDYKTSSVPASARIQTAMYLLGLNYKFHEIERRGVAFRNDGTYQFSEKYPYTDRDEALYHINEYRKEAHHVAH